MGATRPVHPGSLKFHFSQRVVPGRWASGRPERWDTPRALPCPSSTDRHGSFPSSSPPDRRAVRSNQPPIRPLLFESQDQDTYPNVPVAFFRSRLWKPPEGHGLRTFGDSKSDAVRRIALRDDSLALEPRASRQPYLNRSGSHSVPSRTIA